MYRPTFGSSNGHTASGCVFGSQVPPVGAFKALLISAQPLKDTEDDCTKLLQAMHKASALVLQYRSETLVAYQNWFETTD